MSNTPAICGGEPAFPAKLPFVRPWLPVWEDVGDDLRRLVETGMLTKGPKLVEFEQRLAEHLGCRHAVCVSSCTSGLMLSYRALGLEGEAIVPSFTFMATVSALDWCGVKPVFVDVQRETTNIDPTLIESKITPRTSAIVAVHNFGCPADIAALTEIADRRGLKLIFDAAHGFGTVYQGGPVGSQGDAHSFSMSPTKLLAAGEGGVVTTNSDELADYVRVGREYGNSGAYDSAFAGMNARMSEFHAVMGLHALAGLPDAVARRRRVAEIYREILGSVPGVEFQHIAAGNQSSYKDVSILIDEAAFGMSRDQLQAALAAENIDTRNYYDPPVHRHTAYRHYWDGEPLPVTDVLAAGSISLPIGRHIEEDVAQRIAETVANLHHSAPQIAGVGAV